MNETLHVASMLWPGDDTSGWSVGDRRAGRERFVAAPDATEMRHVMPWTLAAVIANTRRPSDDRSARRRIRDAGAASGLLTIGALASSRRVSAPREGSLVEHVARLVGQPDARANAFSGPPRANQKPVLQLHDRRGRPVAYVKVAWSALTRQLLDAEAAALDRMTTAATSGFTTPIPIARGAFGPANWLALAPVSVGRRRRPDQGAIDRLALAIERTSDRWEGRTDKSPYVRSMIDLSDDLALGSRAITLCADRWGKTPMALAASHGDFVPWNIQSGDPEPAVWDWERYRTAVPAGFDRLHHRVQVGLRRGGLPARRAVEIVARDIQAVLPELSPDQQHAHLDWYLVDLLCRYERDAPESPDPALAALAHDLNHIVKDRLTST